MKTINKIYDLVLNLKKDFINQYNIIDYDKHEYSSCVEYWAYKVIDKQHITLIREPIRKTNVVLKNVNFQYAMKLWSYLRDNYDIGLAEEEEHQSYTDTGELKQFIDETFLLQYIAMKTLDEDNESTHKEIQETMVDQMIEKMIDMDVEVTEEQLKDMIVQRFEVIKYKKTEIIKEIQQIFRKHIEKYEEQVEKRGKVTC